MLEQLADHPSTIDPEPFAGPDHPIRKRTRAVAGGEVWTTENATRMAELFDSMAADWSAKHVDDVKAAPVLDLLDRGEKSVHVHMDDLARRICRRRNCLAIHSLARGCASS